MKAPLDYRPPETDPLPVIYADEALMVVVKPAGLLSVPGRLEQHKDCLVSRLQAKYPDVLTVHRLDMDTSGLMVFARGAVMHRALSMAFERKTVTKAYEALVWGEMAEAEGVVDLPLIRDWPNRPKQMVDHKQGKPSRTEWRVVERLDGITRVALTPVTGRTHQLRVHMAETGYGILGDCWYGTSDSMSARERLCLHACELGFENPLTGVAMRFESQAGF